MNLVLFFNCPFFPLLFIVVQVQLSPFFPHHFPAPHPSPPPPLYPTPLWICPCVLYTCSLTTLPPFHPIIPSHFPLVTVSFFFISMSLVLFCLLVCFVDEVPLIGEIIWYLSFTTWLTSLSIMLSSSIHTVTKGRSSFFCCLIFHCVNVPLFFHPLIYRWALRLLPTISYCKLCFYKYWGA